MRLAARRHLLVSLVALLLAPATFADARPPATTTTQERAATGGPATTAPSTAARAEGFGLTAGCCTPQGVNFLDQASGYAASGAGWIRMGLSWSAMEPTRGRFDWSRDLAVSTYRGTGMKVLGVLAYSPAWAADPVCAATYGDKCAPADPADFARFVAAAVERYDGDGVADAPGSPRVDAWELWNEPNIARFWRPAPDPASYTTLLRAGHAAAHRADPTTTVVSAGLSPAGGAHAPIEFLRAMYAHGAKGSFDALGFHPYSYPHVPSKRAKWNAWQQMSGSFPHVGQPDSLRSLMVANGDGDKRIWATEYGAPTGGDTNGDGRSDCDADGVPLRTEDRCLSETQQAALVTEAYTLWQGYPWAGPLFWYSYQDLATGSASIEDNFGLVRSDGRPKPAFAAYRAAARAAAGAAAGAAADGPRG